MYVPSVEEKMTAALQSAPEVVHSEFIEQLDYNERRGLLDTARDMERRNLLKRDVSQIVDGKLVLRYLRVTE